jgi:hypothetical protein
MASQVEYIAHGIVRVQWIDPFRLDDAAWAIDECTRLADAQGDLHYVIIIDLSECSHIPFDLHSLTPFAVIDPRIIAYVVVGADLTVRGAMRLLKRATDPQYIAVASLEDALEAAWYALEPKVSAPIPHSA